MKTFRLEILSPDRAFYRGECVSLIIPISDGMMGIMADHTPLTAAIVDGAVIFEKPDGERVVCAVTQGMVDVSSHGNVKVLCESALHPDEISEEQERRQAEEAMHQLREKQAHRDYVLSQLTFAKAVSHLRVKQHNT